MDTRTRSASPAAPADVKLENISPLQDKISAYYSLVFPHFTFYIQTLSVTIGRRCAPNINAPSSSTAEPPAVDVDLGALKSVSRLHAKIEYDQDEDRFVLVVIGRNGAWVDGVWSGSGTRAPLGERSQIQIASRTFHFVLPPPPPPEDSPSPSSQSSNNRPRSPSVDITSISPPSSQPSHTPPPPIKTNRPAPLPEPQLSPSLSPEAELRIRISPHPLRPLNLKSTKKSVKATSKKRKKGDVEMPVLPKPKPEEMPPKPPFTYAQLIYKAIRAIGDKATLQEICSWIMKTHEYYQFSDASWMSSVRHNLSSSRAFQKLERCGGDRGKGFFWKLDDKHCQALEEQEAKGLHIANGNGSQGVSEGNTKGKKKGKVLLEPPLKRSVKGDLKGTPLPPPLTSTPLVMKSSSPAATTPTAVSLTGPNASFPSGKVTNVTPATTGVFAYPSSHHHMTGIPQPPTVPANYAGASAGSPNPYAAWTMHSISSLNSNGQSPPVAAIAASTQSSPTPALTPSSTIASTPIQMPSASLGQLPTQNNAPSVPDVNLPIVLGPIPPTHPDYSPSHPHNSAKEGYMILHERTLILDPDVFGELTKEALVDLEKKGTMAALQVLKNHMVRVLKERRAKGKGRAKRKGTKKVGTGVSPESKPMQAPAPTVRVDSEESGGLPPVSIQQTSIPDMDVVQDEAGSPIIIVDDSDEGPATKRRKVDE